MLPRSSVSRDSQAPLVVRLPRAAASLGFILFVLILGRAFTIRRGSAEIDAPIKLAVPLAALNARMDIGTSLVVHEENNAPLGAAPAGPQPELVDVAPVTARDSAANADPAADPPPTDIASHGATAGDVVDGEHTTSETVHKQKAEATDAPTTEPSAISLNSTHAQTITPSPIASPAIDEHSSVVIYANSS